MSFPVFIAKRYFWSKKSTNVISIISWISIVGVAVGTASLIIVLSVFNGFESLVVSLYNSFDPHIRIEAVAGKTFEPTKLPTDKISAIKGVKYLVPTLEDNALVTYEDRQFFCTIKGVGKDFVRMTGLERKMTDGRLALDQEDSTYAVLGQGVAYYLSLNRSNPFTPLQIYVPRPGKHSDFNPDDAFNRRFVYASGVFSVQQDFDVKYVLVPLKFASDLFEKGTRISAMEIGLESEDNLEETQAQIVQLCGSDFYVKNRLEQHELLYRIMKSEKWAVFLILTLILIIATFNIIGSLTMLILDKKKDIAILTALGADASLVRKIFLIEGMMISIVGAGIGMFVGYVLCFLQQTYGFVKLQGSGSFVVDAYPVKISAIDFVYIMLTVTLIGFLSAWFPSGKLTSRFINSKNES